MRLAIEPLAGGASITADRLPADAIGRARLLARIGRAIVARAPDADVVIGGRSVLALGAAPAALSGIEHECTSSQHECTSSQHEDDREPVAHLLEAVYDGADLDAVAAASGLPSAEVGRLHGERSYVALVTGFMPGFAYLGELDDRLVRPRLAQPRARVPAGALAIAGRFTGVYPFASPGGWNLIGRVPDAALFDPQRTPARRIAVLDEVRFVASAAPPAVVDPSGAHAIAYDDRPAALIVASVTGIATVQDEGRPGRRGEGIPCSGPLDADGLALANAAAGNGKRCACIEMIGGRLVLRAEQRVWLSNDGAAGVWLAPGDSIVIDPGPRLVAYLGVRGGVDVPEVLGSRSTLLVALLGGHHGRALRAGDRLSVGAAVAKEGAPLVDVEALRSARLEGGAGRPVTLLASAGAPDERLAASAFDQLCRGEYIISAALDRVGVRLDGPLLARLAGDFALPDPVLPGAIQVTTAGTPIVLGPDAAVTGGYPVVGWLDAASRARIGRLRPGTRVVFRRGA